MSKEEFTFLSEHPLKTSEELSSSKFGHEEIARTLAKIIKKCPAPFTIGLFAKWGSGKSTVAYSLKQKLPKEKIPVVIFDVWKHEGDALRRTFLKEMTKQLHNYGKEYFEKGFVLDEKLEHSVSRNSESRFRFSKEKFLQLGWLIVLSIFVIAVLYYVAVKFDFLYLYLNALYSFFGVTTATGLLLFLAKQSLQLLTTETVSYGVDKFEDPQQFEDEFGNVLKALKNKRILIIFDNLDRVMHDKVAEVLSTIKTFLEPGDLADEKKEVIFLVPCDAKAIKQHLSSLYNPRDISKEGNTFDPDEFLRKFFNTIVWIPDFIQSELESFASARLKETKVELLDDNYVAWIITKAFRNNPRQIIQFINILLANYLLVREREGKDKDFPENFLKENIPQLTKYLVLNQLFPDEMDILREKKVLDLDEVQQSDLKTDTVKGFIAFIEQTQNIPIKDLRTYFTLRRSEQEKKMPGSETFLAHLEDRNTEEATTQFDQLGDFSSSELIADFSQVIKKELESKNNPISSINLIYTLFSITLSKKITLTDTLYEEINNLLNTRCKLQMHTIPPNILNDAFLIKKSSYRPAIVSQWISVIEDHANGGTQYKTDRDFIKSALGIFAKQTEYLTAQQEKQLRSVLVNKFSSDVDIAEIITTSPTSQAKLNSNKFVENFIAAVPVGGDLGDISLRIAIINKFENSIFKTANVDTLLKKFTELQEAENQNTKPESTDEKKKLFSHYQDFISQHGSLLETATVSNKDDFITSLISGFNSATDHEAKAIFVPVLLDIKKFASESKETEIEKTIAVWITKVNPEIFIDVLKALSKEDQTALVSISHIYQSILNRSNSDNAFRRVIFNHLSDKQKDELLDKLLSYDFDTAFNFFESINSSHLKNIISNFEKIWASFYSLSNEQKKRILEFIINNKVQKNPEIKENFLVKTISMLTITNDESQQIGLDIIKSGSFSGDAKKRIAKESLEWLKKPEVQPKYQLNLLNTLAFLLEEIGEEERAELIHLIFDEAIRRISAPQDITNSFEVLKNLKPKYEDATSDFDALKTRIENESNANIKTALIEGLFVIKPSRTNKKNQDFWDWLDSQRIQ